jgi:hypothetical protein
MRRPRDGNRPGAALRSSGRLEGWRRRLRFLNRNNPGTKRHKTKKDFKRGEGYYGPSATIHGKSLPSAANCVWMATVRKHLIS